jgi:chlorophyllide a reductase subunit Y
MMQAAAREAGKSEVLDRYAADYPKGPHDQPQSMCPAFGSLRVGLRMRRTATILSGSACCVYGLTFTSHFYGARRTVGYVPFNSESLVTGKLFEDIREAVYQLADPAQYDAIVITNLCVPTASGVPLQILPKEINGVRIIGIDVPGFGVPDCTRRAKDVLAGCDAALNCATDTEARQGPVLGPAAAGAAQAAHRDTGEARCSRPIRSARHAASTGSGSRPGRWCRRASGASSTRRSTAWRGRDPPVSILRPSASSRRRPSDRRLRARRARRHRGVAREHWADGRRRARADRREPQNRRAPPPSRARLAGKPITGRITLSGYEGSELLVARLLVESGADVRYVGTACPRTPYSESDREWLVARGVHVQYRASLEQDVAAMEEWKPDLAIGTTPVVQKAKERAIPGLYFTNLISARPLMGPAGAGSLAMVINAAIGNKRRFDEMEAFFGDTGRGYAAGVWEDTPVDRPEFREHYKRHLAKLARQRKAEEMV